MKFSIKDLFSKMRIWSHLLKKSLMGNFIFCTVCLFLRKKCLILLDLTNYSETRLACHPRDLVDLRQ